MYPLDCCCADCCGEENRPPQQFPRSRYNNPYYQSSYSTQGSTARHSYLLSDSYIRQNSPNDFYRQSSLTRIADGNCEQNVGGFASRSNEHPDMFDYSNTSDIHYIVDSNFLFTNPPQAGQLRGTDIGDNVAGGFDQPGSWATQRSSQVSIMGNAGKDYIPSESSSNSLDNQAPLNNSVNPENPSTLYNGPIHQLDPNAFRELRGYRGHMNDYKLLDCFGDCKKGRFGERGISRRGNLITHLRNCHGQAIPKGAPV